MKQEWRNLKGEIVRTTGRNDGEGPRRLSVSTWTLLLGLILFNIGCFINPSLFDRFIRLLDVRLWPWWYFPIALVVVAFSVGWLIIYLRRDEYDELQAERAKRFIRFSVYLTVLGIVFLAVRPFFFMRQINHALAEWFRAGDFSLLALGSFLAILALTIPAVYFAKEWLVSVFGDHGA